MLNVSSMFSQWGIENFYVVFLYSVKERVTKSMPLLLHSHGPKPVQISGLETGTRLSYEQTSQTADLEKYIQSGLLLRSWNKRYHFELPYYFSWFMAPLFTDQSVYFCILLCSSASHLKYKVMGKPWPQVLPVITYIYLCGRIYASFFIVCFKQPAGIGQKLN
jgi:hypothetical protein